MVRLVESPTPKKIVKHQIVNTADISENVIVKEDDSLLNLSNGNNKLISSFQKNTITGVEIGIDKEIF